MREAVSDVLIDRAREAEGFTRMVLYSLAAHVALVATIVVLPDSWRAARLDRDAAVMTITLGGAPGPEAGGMTPIAGRAVQAVTPPDAKPTPQPAPAAKPPEMVAPESAAKPAPKTPPKIEKPEDKSASRRPTTGPEVKSGAARVDTGGAPVPFGGLTTGGGGGSGARLDVQNFCCPGYLTTMTQIIQRSWNQNQGASGEVTVKFTIHRDGMIADEIVETPSGLFVLDQEALRAVVRSRKLLPPLPREFPDSTLTVHLVFQYQR